MKRKSSSLKFTDSKDMDKYLEETDLGKEFARYGELHKPEVKKIHLDLPEWLIHQLDIEASRVGIARQPLIKLWLAQKLDEERKKRQK